MDNNDIKEIKELIVARSTDIIAITTIWGLTNYVDNARNEEKGNMSNSNSNFWYY